MDSNMSQVATNDYRFNNITTRDDNLLLFILALSIIFLAGF